MSRMLFALVAILACLSVYVFADESADRRKAETKAQADLILGQRYTPGKGKPSRFYNEQTATGPPDEVIYWHGSSYVVELKFAADGSIAALVLLPEPLLYSNDGNDVPDSVELSAAEMQWFVASANALQPLGKKDERAVHFCFQSGRNLYCGEGYHLASVSYYEIEQRRRTGPYERILKDIQITYKQTIQGTVEDMRVENGQRQMKIDGQWYQGERSGQGIFDTAQIGDFVRFATNGCTANEKACPATGENRASAPNSR